MKNRTLLALSATLMALGAPGISRALADTSLQDLNDRANNSANILDTYMTDAKSSIPDSLLRQAQCIVVIPSFVKGGFIFGGEAGSGLATCRTEAGWSTPSFTSIAGGSFGFQAGLESTDLVMVFMNKDAAGSLSGGNFTLDGNVSVAVGPVGRDAQAGTDYQLKSEIYTYSRSRGIYAGISLDGSVVSADNDDNSMMYGSSVEASQLLITPSQNTPAPITHFLQHLEHLSAGIRHAAL
jgi:lipid-binding SYLF domain-containing protein